MLGLAHAMVRAEIVTVLGKAYVGVSLILFTLGLIWFSLVLQENRAWVEVVLLVPRFDFVDPLVRKRVEMNVALVMAGWGGCASLLLALLVAAPFRVRSQAIDQRRRRELEREILELRTLPLRQQEEDEILAAEARLESRAKKVMTEKMRRERMLGESGTELTTLDTQAGVWRPRVGPNSAANGQQRFGPPGAKSDEDPGAST